MLPSTVQFELAGRIMQFGKLIIKPAFPIWMTQLIKVKYKVLVQGSTTI